MNDYKGELVSILVPIYNGEKYIERCLSCILSQEYQHIQLIMINDGSNDKTDDLIKEMLDELSHKLDDVLYLTKENGGVGSAINYGLKYFNGEFLYLYDVDDILLPNAVQDCVTFLIENQNYSVVQANGYYVTEEGLDSKERLFFDSNYRIENDDLFLKIISGATFNWPGSYMIRSIDWQSANKSRNIYESRSGQNMQMLFPATYKHKSGLLDVPVMKYIVHPQSLSHFEGKDAYIKEIEATKSYQDIYYHVIDHLINTEEKIEVCKIIDSTFNHSRFNIALKYNEENDIKRYFNLLKDSQVLTINDKINYYHKFNKLKWLFLKIVRRIKLLVK